MEIRLINGKWTINSKPFEQMTPNEKIILDKFFEDYKHDEKYSKGKPKSKSR